MPLSEEDKAWIDERLIAHTERLTASLGRVEADFERLESVETRLLTEFHR